MSQQDWTRFSVRINIKNISAEKLYWAWATREGIESWFLRVSEYKNPDGSLLEPNEPAQKGNVYLWKWHGYADHVKEEGEILEANGHNNFRFRFGTAGICTVTIKEEEGEKIVELIQEQISTDEKSKFDYHVGCKTGWTFYLANLKSMMEGGIDLRNRNEREIQFRKIF